MGSSPTWPTVNVYDNFYVSVTWQEALQEVRVFRAIGLGIVTKQHPFDRGCDRAFYATLALTVEHRFSNPGVIGSNPIGSLLSNLITSITNKKRRHICLLLKCVTQSSK